MVRQINLDSWQITHLTDLLKKGVGIHRRTDRPVEIYRKSFEEKNSCYEEIVCTIIDDYILEQRVISGGPMPPQFVHQIIYNIKEYPEVLLKKNKERFLKTVATLEALE